MLFIMFSGELMASHTDLVGSNEEIPQVIRYG